MIRYRSEYEYKEISKFAKDNKFKSVQELYRKSLANFAGEGLKSVRDQNLKQLLEMQESIINSFNLLIKKIERNLESEDINSQISMSLTSLKITNELIKTKIIKG